VGKNPPRRPDKRSSLRWGFPCKTATQPLQKLHLHGAGLMQTAMLVVRQRLKAAWVFAFPK
jgi:hypothetical protein